MIERLLQWSLRARLFVFILVLFVAGGGYLAFRNLTIEAFPDPTDTQVQIITVYPGQPTEEVEHRISIPIERALNGVPGVYRQRSVSLFGLSVVTLTFDDGVNPLVARQQVTERLPDAELPDGITPEMDPDYTPIGEIYRYTLEGADPMTLRTLQDWTMRPALMQVPGVADVVCYGGLVKEIHVQPSPTKMAADGVVLDDLFKALSNASRNASGGVTERGESLFVIRSLGTFRSLDDIRNVRVGYHDGVPVRVEDVATVTEGYEPRQGVVTRWTTGQLLGQIEFARGSAELPSSAADVLAVIAQKLAAIPYADHLELRGQAAPGEPGGAALATSRAEAVQKALIAHGVPAARLKAIAYTSAVPGGRVDAVIPAAYQPDTAEGIVLMLRGQNPSVVLAALRKRIDELQARALPPGVHIHPFYDRTELVDTTLHTVFHNLLEGALLVTFVLFVFLVSLRASLVVAIVIPLSLASAFIYLHLRGMSANLLSMGAVDFGIIVDGAVILVEHVFGHLAGDRYQAMTPAERSEAIYRTSSEVARPTLFSLMIIIAAYLPIFALQRIEGKIFSPMAHTVVSALVGAMLVSFTLVPVLCFFALRKHKAIQESFVLRGARKAYDPVLRGAMRNPAAVLIGAFALLCAGVELAPRLGTEFMPVLNEGSLYVTFTLPSAVSLTEGRKLTPKILALMKKGLPEVTELQTQLGRPEDGTDPTLPSNLEVFVKLRPMDEWRPQFHSLDDIVAVMNQNLKAIPGIEYNFSQPIRDNVAENIKGQFGEISVKIYGDDLSVLDKVADEVSAQIGKVAGVADLGVVRMAEQPAIGVEPDRVALARWNLDLGSLQDYVETALSGHTAAEWLEAEKRFDVTVRLPPASRETTQAIRELRVPLEDGALVPVSALAKVTETVSREQITREHGKRYIGIRMNVRGRDLGSFVAEAQRNVAAHVKVPTGYEMDWGGDFADQQRAMHRLELVLPLSVLLTFLLLFSAFGTVWDATIILLNLPVALLGGLAALGFANMTLSVSAAVGFIALLGQTVLNGVLVVSAIRARLDKGQDLWTATIEGARERLRAILMTALLASLGLLPAAMSHAIGSETQRPIAVVVVGGTISSALLTLIVLPVSYYWAGAARAWWHRRRGRPVPPQMPRATAE